MVKEGPTGTQPPSHGIRWWPGLLLAVLAAIALFLIRTHADWPFQKRNIGTAQTLILTTVLGLIWWTFLARAPSRLRLSVTYGLIGLGVLGFALFRVRAMTGDLMPVFEFRWAKGLRPAPASLGGLPPGTALPPVKRTNDAFPQFGGPHRDGVLRGPVLETRWAEHPPRLVWRSSVGAACSGFAIAEGIAITQEQRGEDECIVAYDLATGRQRWLHSDKARYATLIAGEGPRATPTVVDHRVYAFGATGLLNCLELTDGHLVWSRDVIKTCGGHIPDWGCASSPLAANGLIIVHGGEGAGTSLQAFHAVDGTPAWSGGPSTPSYASPSLTTFAGVLQVVAFNHRSVSGSDPSTGAILWKRSWGNGNVVCSSPVWVGSNRVVFSSGYGVGAELLEISRDDAGKFSAARVWQSIRMKAKFGHLYAQDGFLYGLDDGIFACVSLADGSQRWKEGRYGHGQGLRVGELYLLMAESGEVVLLRPTPDAPNELARWRVLGSKTWNPMALSGDLLLVRNDQEAVCLQLPLAHVKGE